MLNSRFCSIRYIHLADLPFENVPFTVCSQACPALAIFLFSNAIRDWACFSPLRWPSITRTLEPGDLHRSHDSGLLKPLPIFLKSINFSWCLRLSQCCLRWNNVANANVQAWQTSTAGWFTMQLEEAWCSGKTWELFVGTFLFNPSWLRGGPCEGIKGFKGFRCWMFSSSILVLYSNSLWIASSADITLFKVIISSSMLAKWPVNLLFCFLSEM